MATKKRRRRKNRINPIAIGILVVFLILVTAASAFLIKKYSPSKERMDLDAYFKMEDENDLAVIIQNTIIENKGIVLDNRPYVSTDTVKAYLNDRFYWDSAENLYIYTTPTEMITAHVGENQYTIDKQTIDVDYQIVKVEEGIAYVALEYIQQYTAMEYDYMTEPNRVQITCEYGEAKVVEAKKNGEVRLQDIRAQS